MTTIKFAIEDPDGKLSEEQTLTVSEGGLVIVKFTDMKQFLYFVKSSDEDEKSMPFCNYPIFYEAEKNLRGF